MKIAVANVGLQGFRDSESNAARIGALTKLLQSTENRNLDALVLPAGFLTVATQEQLPSIIAKWSEAVSPFRVATVFGVDVLRKSEVALRPQSGVNLPYFVYVHTNAEIGGPWRQRSIQSGEEYLISERDVRTTAIDGEQVGVLLSGEIFNRRLRAYYVNDTSIKTIVVPAHVCEGRWNAISTTARALFQDGNLSDLLISLHVSKPVKHRAWCRRGSQQGNVAVSANGKAPWIDAAVFKF